MRLGVLGAGAIACDMAAFLAKAGRCQFAQLLRCALSAATDGTEGVSLPINIWGVTLLTGRQQADQPSRPHRRPLFSAAMGRNLVSDADLLPDLALHKLSPTALIALCEEWPSA